jgi:hypothetical protein
LFFCCFVFISPSSSSSLVASLAPTTSNCVGAQSVLFLSSPHVHAPGGRGSSRRRRMVRGIRCVRLVGIAFRIGSYNLSTVAAWFTNETFRSTPTTFS